MEKKFIESERGWTCPECGGEAMYWEVNAEGNDALLDVLHCDHCGTTWERIYEYAYSRRIEN